jgi:hypothetical protein
MQRILRLPLATRAPLDSPFTLSYGRCDFIVVAIRFIPAPFGLQGHSANRDETGMKRIATTIKSHRP